jgi:Flp pilus assembly pilin Flp
LPIKDKLFKIKQNIDLTPPLTQNSDSCGSERAPGRTSKLFLKSNHQLEAHIMRDLLNTMQRFCKNEEGAALVEYAVLLGIILAVSVGVFSAIGSDTKTIFGSLSTMMGSAAAP